MCLFEFLLFTFESISSLDINFFYISRGIFFEDFLSSNEYVDDLEELIFICQIEIAIIC